MNVIIKYQIFEVLFEVPPSFIWVRIPQLLVTFTIVVVLAGIQRPSWTSPDADFLNSIFLEGVRDYFIFWRGYMKLEGVNLISKSGGALLI